MRAMILEFTKHPLKWGEVPVPKPGSGQVLVKIHACAICRTDLHVIDGELPNSKLPLIPGHEIVGTVAEIGVGVHNWNVGDRIGIGWLGWTCGECKFCCSGRENLCERARFTGYTINGGYAEYAVADSKYCFEIPPEYSDVNAAPLLCAGMIGYRSLLKAGDADRLGIYGFGAAAHIVTQIATFEGRQVFAFTRRGDVQAQKFAEHFGACWAGSSDERPPELLDAAIIFAPAGDLIPQALRSLDKGGTLVCGGIHMTDIPQFPYELLWQERSICSVANLTRHDGEKFLSTAARVPIRTEIQEFPLERANEALAHVRTGRVTGSAVLTM